jgi:4-hydroxy-tetrahydrodipicolinate synthase
MAIEGILPVIPTPFRDGSFDRSSFQRLLEHMLPSVDGYTLLGSTGEAPSLSTAERMQVAEVALAMTPADKTVVVGVTHTSLQDAVTLATHAQEHGARAVLCAMPFYFANTPSGLLRYLTGLDEALSIELVLYDNPEATGTTLGVEQVVGYASELAHLHTVKLTEHQLGKIAHWQRAGLRVLAGDDPILFRFLAAGVDGAMVIAPCLFPAAFRRVWELTRAGDLAPALAVMAETMLPVMHVFGIGDEIATSKVLLAQMGVFADPEVRPPLETVDAGRAGLLRAALDLVASANAEYVAPVVGGGAVV